jgi:hypothetical protein
MGVECSTSYKAAGVPAPRSIQITSTSSAIALTGASEKGKDVARGKVGVRLQSSLGLSFGGIHTSKPSYFYCNRSILSRRDEDAVGTDPCGRASGRFAFVRCEGARR